MDVMWGREEETNKYKQPKPTTAVGEVNENEVEGQADGCYMSAYSAITSFTLQTSHSPAPIGSD